MRKSRPIDTLRFGLGHCNDQHRAFKPYQTLMTDPLHRDNSLTASVGLRKMQRDFVRQVLQKI